MWSAIQIAAGVGFFGTGISGDAIGMSHDVATALTILGILLVGLKVHDWFGEA